MPNNLFTRHPTEIGESYGEHLVHAGGFGLKMIGGGIACVLHGIFPFLFVTKGSETVRGLHSKIVKRADKPNWERHPII